MKKQTFPRSSCTWLWIPAEVKLYEASMEVEKMGADPMLTEAVIKIAEAKKLISDYIDKCSGICE